MQKCCNIFTTSLTSTEIPVHERSRSNADRFACENTKNIRNTNGATGLDMWLNAWILRMHGLHSSSDVTLNISDCRPKKRANPESRDLYVWACSLLPVRHWKASIGDKECFAVEVLPIGDGLRHKSQHLRIQDVVVQNFGARVTVIYCTESCTLPPPSLKHAQSPTAVFTNGKKCSFSAAS